MRSLSTARRTRARAQGCSSTVKAEHATNSVLGPMACGTCGGGGYGRGQAGCYLTPALECDDHVSSRSSMCSRSRNEIPVLTGGSPVSGKHDAMHSST